MHGHGACRLSSKKRAVPRRHVVVFRHSRRMTAPLGPQWWSLSPGLPVRGQFCKKPVRPVPASHDTLAPRTAPGKARWNRAVADNENLVGGGPQHRAAVDLAIKATDDRAAPKQRKISGLIRRAQRLQWGRLPIGGGEFSRPVCRQYRFRRWTYHCDAERTGMR